MENKLVLSTWATEVKQNDLNCKYLEVLNKIKKGFKKWQFFLKCLAELIRNKEGPERPRVRKRMPPWPWGGKCRGAYSTLRNQPWASIQTQHETCWVCARGAITAWTWNPKSYKLSVNELDKVLLSCQRSSSEACLCPRIWGGERTVSHENLKPMPN